LIQEVAKVTKAEGDGRGGGKKYWGRGREVVFVRGTIGIDYWAGARRRPSAGLKEKKVGAEESVRLEEDYVKRAAS